MKCSHYAHMMDGILYIYWTGLGLDWSLDWILDWGLEWTLDTTVRFPLNFPYLLVETPKPNGLMVNHYDFMALHSMWRTFLKG